MSVEVLLLINIGGLTLLAYLVAINAHGPTKLALSYLVATLMLAGTVFVVVQYVNSGVEAERQQQIQQLAAEKQKVEQQLKEEQARSAEGAVQKNTSAAAEKLRGLVTRGSALANRMIALDLQDRSVDFDALVGRATALGREVDQVKQDIETAAAEAGPQLPEACASLKEAASVLKEAAYYCRQFYNSEDSDQEELRGRVMRQKARSANDLFQKATGQIGG